jgi:hypothetical protein
VTAAAGPLSKWAGYCPICETEVEFLSYGSWHRDQLVCARCGSVPRQRALIYVLGLVRPGWARSRIWELAPAGPASERLRRACSAYIGSQYWPDVAPGEVVDGIRCEDLERPTLEDGSVDAIVSSDVFEHIVDVDAALAQVARVLDRDGIHVWTTPQYREIAISNPRVRRVDGRIEHLAPPQYHGDPVNPDGALVTIDWGQDLADRVRSASGLSTMTFRIESPHHGLLGEHLEVFVSHRGRGGPVADAAARHLGQRVAPDGAPTGGPARGVAVTLGTTVRRSRWWLRRSRGALRSPQRPEP